MPCEFDKLLQEHEYLLDEDTSSNGFRRFPLYIPVLPSERSIEAAWLEVPSGFTDGDSARIMLPKKYALKIPHVESDGRLCIDGDPGPLSGSSPSDRIEQLIDLFYSTFLEPWLKGDLDNHFLKEAMNYWEIHCSRYLSSQLPIVKIYTIDERSDEPRIYKSTFIESKRLVIAGVDSSPRNRYLSSLGDRNKLVNVVVAEIPISFPFVPDNWPKGQKDIQRLVTAKVGLSGSNKFFTSVGRRNRRIHRVVVFRAPGCAFGYLLPGGPPAIFRQDRSIKSYPSNCLVPLKVERLDISWTTGRDQHPEYRERQKKHALIIGAGALGSPISEQLAKAGVGRLTIVDDDLLCSANIGRHSLGADSIGASKAHRLADSISKRWPSCLASGFSKSIQSWLNTFSLENVDIILDLTGEPSVRLRIDQERRRFNKNLLIAWMEPFVAAAHACALPSGFFWVTNGCDRLESLNSVDWPDEVMTNEPACSSRFQSYTSAAAAHAVALTTEAALDLLDGKIKRPVVRHWIRGQKYLDKCYPGLQLREWAMSASGFDGLITEEIYD